MNLGVMGQASGDEPAAKHVTVLSYQRDRQRQASEIFRRHAAVAGSGEFKVGFIQAGVVQR